MKKAINSYIRKQVVIKPASPNGHIKIRVVKGPVRVAAHVRRVK